METRPISPVERSNEYGHVRRFGAIRTQDHLVDDIFLESDEILQHLLLIMTSVLANLLGNRDHLLAISQVVQGFPQQFLNQGFPNSLDRS